MCVSHAVMADSVALWTIARQAPLSMGFSRQESWSGLPCPPPGALPDSGIGPTSLMSPALVGRFFINSITWEAQYCVCVCIYIYTYMHTYIYTCHLINMYQEPLGAGDGQDSFSDIGRSVTVLCQDEQHQETWEILNDDHNSLSYAVNMG